MADSTRCIAIVGAGFCGTVTAINLLQQSHREPLRIVLIDRQRHARGSAYAAQTDAYLLNVPAGRMSAFSSDPMSFLRFAQRTHPAVTAEDFLPRALYGDYLEEALLAAERQSPPHIKLERLRGAVHSLDIWRPGHTFILEFQNGHELMATEVVLALGNGAPTELGGCAELRTSMRVIENPWSEPQRFARDESVLIVGTGLTMADTVCTALQSGGGPRQVHALSRHGLVPPGQTAFRHSHSQFDALPLLRVASFSMRQLFRAVRQICRAAEEQGGDWREAITFVRTLAPRLWSKLPLRERRRFLRHAKVYWDIHRHRLPPSVRASIDELRQTQRLIVHAGRLVHLEPEDNRVRVTWRARGQEQTSVLVVDRVLNCTGPDYRCRSSRDPLIRNLVANGLIQPDELDTGLRTAPSGRVLNLMGQATRGLYYVGPMLRADHWEATAVQELREHAERLVQQLVPTTEHRAARAATGEGVIP